MNSPSRVGVVFAIGVQSADAGKPGSLGGHVGVALSLVGLTGTGDGLFRNSVIGDDATHLMVPIGVTLRKTKRLSIDWEFVIHNHSDGGGVGLTVDPIGPIKMKSRRLIVPPTGYAGCLETTKYAGRA